MSTALQTEPATPEPVRPVPGHTERPAVAALHARLTFSGVMRGEWIKLLSLRSTWWVLTLAVVLMTLFALGQAMSLDLLAESPEGAAIGLIHGAEIVSGGYPLGTVTIAVLGALLITGEYSTGMIRSTLTAEPRRGAVLVAKALVVAVVLALTTAVTYAIAVLTTAPILKTAIDWSDPTLSWFPLLAGVFAMAMFALIGLGFGFIVRNGAGAIAATVGVLFVLPIVLSMFSFAGEGWKWIVDASAYLPMSGAQSATTAGGEDVMRGLVTLAAWPAALLLGAWASLRSRDT